MTKYPRLRGNDKIFLENFVKKINTNIPAKAWMTAWERSALG
jgi:hypothetical protein